jgi:hypothetical protein
MVAIGREGDAANNIGVADECLDFHASIDIPDPHSLIL